MPITNGVNGRDSNGRFTKGNRGGPGNPHASHVHKLRGVLLEAVSETDIKKVVQILIGKAMDGDMAAIRILFERALGKPLEHDILERIERLEAGV
jgi:hypothetical protein